MILFAVLDYQHYNPYLNIVYVCLHSFFSDFSAGDEREHKYLQTKTSQRRVNSNIYLSPKRQSSSRVRLSVSVDQYVSKQNAQAPGHIGRSRELVWSNLRTILLIDSGSPHLTLRSEYNVCHLLNTTC